MSWLVCDDDSLPNLPVQCRYGRDHGFDVTRAVIADPVDEKGGRTVNPA